MKKVVWAFLLAGAAPCALLFGCNNGSCTAPSKCQNDTPMDQTSCQNKMNDSKCGGLYNDYLACFQSNQVCTEQGTTDPTITNGTCGDQYGKWVSCYYGADGGATDQ